MAFKILSASDFHLKIRDPNDTQDESRLQRRLMNLDVCVSKAIESKVDMFVCMGDSYDHPEPSSQLRSELNNRIVRLVMAGIQVRWLVGNHESVRTRHAFMPEKEIFGSQVIVDETGFQNIGGIRLIFVPYYSGLDEEIHDKIKEFSKTENCVLFGHFGVTGAKRIANQTKTFDLDSEVSNEALSNFLRVFIGHYHIPQELGNVTIVGSIVRNNFGEMGYMPRGLLIEIDGTEITQTDIPLKDLDFVRHEVNEDDLIPKPHEVGVYQYVLTGKTSWIAETSRELKKYSTSSNRVNIVPKPTDRRQDSGQKDNEDLTITSSMQKYVEDFTGKSFSFSEGDRKGLLTLGREILNDSIENTKT